MKNTISLILKGLASYFIQGLLFVVPIAGTILLILYLFSFLDGIIQFEYPGLGILILVSGLTFVGFLANTIIAKPIINYFEKLINRAPLLKLIYTALADLVGAFVGKKKSFNQPVLVKISDEQEIEKPGFVTSEDLEKVGIEGDKVAVYCPHSYAFSGYVIIVPSKNITPVNVKAADFMKFIVSGGVTKMEKKTEKPSNE